MESRFEYLGIGDYLDEFTFRFNRRTSESRGKLFYRLVEQAAWSDTVSYADIMNRRRV